MACTNRRSNHPRIEVELVHVRGESRAHRELAAFACYCVARLEKELGALDRWIVRVAPSASGFTSRVAVHDRGIVAEVEATGFDGPLAIWDAMCRIEQRVRELRAPHLHDARA